jgi:sulfite reductase (NADPH) hemoprotein beta-component
VPPAARDGITQLLAEHGVPVENQASVIRRASIACPALPTCGLALAESERTMPDVLNRIEGVLAELGLKDEEIIIRMTGCPNGCARPFTAELALVGRAPGKYQLYVGGNQAGTRLGELFRESVKSDDIANELRPWFSRFAQERIGAERFGDFCQRVLLREEPAAPG